MRSFQPSRIPPPRQMWNHRLNCLDIEIGCGVGLFAATYAIENPNRNVIAIDKSKVRHQKMLDRIEQLGGIANLFPVRENALRFVTHYVQKSSVDRFFIWYPNPYPKKKQANRRWHQMPFMGFVIETLSSGGHIHMATNMEFYAAECVEYMTKVWKLKLVHQKTLNRDSLVSFKPRTHFEKKYLERGETCWDLTFQKESKNDLTDKPKS